jgi:hypothetical protein
MSQYTTEVVMIPDTIRSIDSATFSGAYQAIGGPLTRPIRIFKFVNNSNALVTISWDGVNAHDILPAGSFFLYDITANHSNVEGTQGQYVRVGTQFYVKGAAGVGSVYLVCLG